MALPTTNLTLHVNATDNDHLWQAWQAGTPFHNTPSNNGDIVAVWDDDDGKDLTLLAWGGTYPTFKLSPPVMPTANLNFVTAAPTGPNKMRLYDRAATTAKNTGNILGASDFVIVMAIRLGIATANDSTLYLNDGLLSDSAGYWSLTVRNNAGVHTLNFYNYSTASGGINTISLNVATGVDYVVAWWHTGGTMFAEVYNASGLVTSNSVASGATDNQATQFRVGMNANDTSSYNGQIAGLATYNAYVLTDKNNAITEFRAVYLGSGAALDITTTTLPSGTVGAAYSQTLAASGGTAPYTWSLNSGSLPPGLSLSAGGAITGTPTTAGTYNPVFKVTDSVSAIDTQAITMVINSASTPTLATITPSNLPLASQAGDVTVRFQFTGTNLSGSSPTLTPPSAWTVVGTPTITSTTIDSYVTIPAGTAAGTKTFTFATTAGSANITMSLTTPTGGSSGDTGGIVRFNVGFN